MSSQLDDVMVPAGRGRNASDVFLVWNRRVHYYLGLYLLFFCWLFVLTGLLLNHPRWEFAQFWPNRVQSTTEHGFQVPQARTDLERARDLMRQFGIAGEIQWPAAQSTGGALAFQVSRPGLVVDVKANLESGRATLQRNALNTQDGANTNVAVEGNGDLLDALARLRDVTSHRLNVLDLPRAAKVFDGDYLYVLKPIGQRFWTGTAALNDADEIAGSILMQSSKDMA